jgi:hypothetical protein
MKKIIELIKRTLRRKQLLRNSILLNIDKEKDVLILKIDNDFNISDYQLEYEHLYDTFIKKFGIETIIISNCEIKILKDIKNNLIKTTQIHNDEKKFTLKEIYENALAECRYCNKEDHEK